MDSDDVTDTMVAVLGHGQRPISFLISSDVYRRAAEEGIDLTGFAPVRRPSDQPRIVGLSTDMHTGETVPVLADPDGALRALAPPGPRNRAERRALR